MITKEQMIDYLQCDISSFGFQDLHDLVINKENCITCGACLTICPRISIRENKPKLIDYDPQCSLCYKYCPRTFFPKKFFEKEIFNEKTQKDSLVGHYQKIAAAKSTDNKILRNAQNGGVTTTLLIQALNTGLIDGVLMTNKDENWYPKPFIARTPEEVISAAGSIYAMVPTLSIYKEAVYKYKIENLGFVGLPCQIQAVRKFQLWPPLSDKYGKFKLIIGLFCSSNYSYESMYNLVKDLIGVSTTEIKKFDVSHGKFIAYLNDGTIKEVSIKGTSKYHFSSCKFCKDYTAEFSDISIGSIGSPENTWNSVIIRSDVGMNIFNDALNSKKIITSDQIDISKINNEALRKKLKVIQINEKVISALELFDVPELEAKIYATLLSLGNADSSMVNTIIKREPSEVNRALNILKQRKWISVTNEFYKPNNPVKVFKEEIHYLKEKFNNDLKKFKSEAFKELETVYIQNNLKYVEDNEFIDYYFLCILGISILNF